MRTKGLFSLKRERRDQTILSEQKENYQMHGSKDAINCPKNGFTGFMPENQHTNQAAKGPAEHSRQE